ncbi:MAG: peptidylprolyl isomerase [Gammaproteobacteria bacterium]|nr:peptidylprolyl isomerase [Gammaproteobacteria bacterium]MDH5799178.1 peptidylprolyl isomerase [Gammaproteobacteria bacterium]
MIRLQTNFGNIDIEVDHDKAPVTAKNFERYVSEGFYDGTLFHRVIDGFMIQGGGMEAGMQPKATHDPIKNEANNGLTNEVGTIAMARTNDPHSASSQFFINVAKNDFLNFTSEDTHGWGYCVFGKVVDGMDVVNNIKGQSTTSKMGHQDVPVDDIVIEKAEML